MALLVVGGVVAAVVTISGSGGRKDTATGRRLIVPQSSGPYSRLTSSEADRLAATLRAQVSSGLRAGAQPSLAVYGVDGDDTPVLLYLGFNADDLVTGRATLREFVDGVMLGAGVKDAEDVPPGPLGGTFRCGVQRSFCAWSDDSTGGALFYYQPPPTGTLAATALQFRSDAEH